MNRAIVLTGTAALFAAFARRRREPPFGGIDRECFADVASFKQFELATQNLKAATMKVDNSAAEVEVALRTLATA